MSLYKICKSIDYDSKEWKDYCSWRNKDFNEFKSLDSTIQKSIFEPKLDSDWSFVVNTGQYLTDVVNDLEFAKEYSKRVEAQSILSFDFIDSTAQNREVIGYDILDGALSYSLLTNFGSNINIVNKHLNDSGLISNKADAIRVHKWFSSEMPDDAHVEGSKICSVYQQTETNKIG